MALRPKAQGAWPSHLTEFCELPEWVQGQWEYIHVQGGTVLLKDNRNFKTYTARCIKSRNEEKFLIYAIKTTSLAFNCWVGNIECVIMALSRSF